MSVVEDTRKLIQDFLTPELRELAARVEALEKRLDIRVEALEKRMVTRFDAAERLASEGYTRILQAINGLADTTELRERIARIEALQKAS